MDLEPIDPETALDLYLAEKESEYAASTIGSHRSRLNFFVRWCAEHGIDDLNDLTGRQLHEFRLWRREGAASRRPPRRPSSTPCVSSCAGSAPSTAVTPTSTSKSARRGSRPHRTPAT